MSAIAKRWEVPLVALIAANNLESPNTIYQRRHCIQHNRICRT
ncbi:hypothetical protein GC098_29885 [Paenibacillus sp. LMG 31458]|uniref:LysM domain-containing protein n=1 Tax=Paenibacillus phytorum TaxID=2654977 RepID=A0ABX1Y3U5_9BACL|nr:hypothetical protein [Paenibacillus phytorum]